MSDSVEIPTEAASIPACHGTATYEENGSLYCGICGAFTEEATPPVDEPTEEPVNG